MPKHAPKLWARAIFRWYLNKFPLRDGKAYFYQLWHGKLAPEERFTIATLDRGFKMKLDLGDEEQLKIYFYGHYHERYEARLIELLLDPEEAFWDVGANIGYFSLVAATALKGRGQVVAFEPGSAACQRLSENVSLNRLGNIKIYNLAVSDTEGEAVLYVSGDIADSSANLYSPGAAQARQEVCRTVSLDKLRVDESLPFPAFIKVDVEGAELAVLKGAEDLISQHRPLLLVEMEEKNLRGAGASKAAIQAFLKDYGYRAAFLRKGRWQATEEVEGVRGRNIFWFNPSLSIHKEKIARLPIYRNCGCRPAGSRLSL